MIFRVSVKHPIFSAILETFEGTGSEDDADGHVERLGLKWPDAKVRWDEIEEEQGSLAMPDHPLDGMPASIVNETDNRFLVRLLADRGVFRSGDMVGVPKSDWQKKK